MAIGKKSCGSLLTGGTDKRVNVWTVGEKNKTLVRRSAACLKMLKRAWGRRFLLEEPTLIFFCVYVL